MKKLIENISVKLEILNHNVSMVFGTFLLFAFAPQFLLKLVESYIPYSFAFYVSTAICYVLLIYLFRWILHKNFYHSFDREKWTGIYLPLVIIISVSWLTLICFGALTSALYDAGAIQFDPAPEHHNFSAVSDFYFWHALDLVPALGINDIFQLKVPFTYNQVGVSFLLLAFKIIIAWIIIVQVYNWYEWKKGK